MCSLGKKIIPQYPVGDKPGTVAKHQVRPDVSVKAVKKRKRLLVREFFMHPRF
ncbi:hypothetical protein ES703_25793 [subsurface metagenome]